MAKKNDLEFNDSFSNLFIGLESNVLLEFYKKNWDDLWNHKPKKDPRNVITFCRTYGFFAKEIVWLWPIVIIINNYCYYYYWSFAYSKKGKLKRGRAKLRGEKLPGWHTPYEGLKYSHLTCRKRKNLISPKLQMFFPICR